MARALGLMFGPDDVVELRSIRKHADGSAAIQFGYFDCDHWEVLMDQADLLNRQGAQVYVTMNPVNPELLSRAHNRMSTGRATADKDVLKRRIMLVDVDPERPTGTASTKEQLEAAKNVTAAIHAETRARGWPPAIIAMSGNGYHLLYTVDLPNDADSNDLIKRALAGLGAICDASGVKVDRVVHNAARITKLYGTVATKGANTEAAPWRLSRVEWIPKVPHGQIVTVEQLQSVAAFAPADAKVAAAPRPPYTGPVAGSPGSFCLEDYLSRVGLTYDLGTAPDGREMFRLDACPFNSDHERGDAAVFRAADGKLGFKCFHNSCADKAWGDVRNLLDSPKETRAGADLSSIDIHAAMAAQAARKATGGLVEGPGRYQHQGRSEPVLEDGAEEELSNLSHAPKFDYACVPGVLGRFIKAETEFSEAPPIGILANLVTRLCADIGRAPYIQLGRQKLHLRMNWLCAGPSALGRKGTAAGIARGLRDAAFALQPAEELERMNPAVELRSLSTGEGLVSKLRTSLREDDGAAGPPGLVDNRILVDAQEFAGVLHKASGPQSTLSPVLRDAYDGGTLQNASIVNAAVAERPHVNVNASVPDTELVKLLSGESAVETDNGLLNRFVLTWQRRDKVVANPKGGALWIWDQMAEAYALALRTAWGGVPRYAVSMESTIEIAFTAEAQRFLDDWYVTEQARIDAPKVQGLLLRQGNVLRVYSALLVLLRGSTTIEVEDLRAGLALLKYWRDSLEYLFTQGREVDEALRMHDDVGMLLSHLKVGVPARPTHLKDVLTKERREAALRYAQRMSPPAVTMTRMPRPGGGRPIIEITRLL